MIRDDEPKPGELDDKEVERPRYRERPDGTLEVIDYEDDEDDDLLDEELEDEDLDDEDGDEDE